MLKSRKLKIYIKTYLILRRNVSKIISYLFRPRPNENLHKLLSCIKFLEDMENVSACCKTELLGATKSLSHVNSNLQQNLLDDMENV